MDDVFRALADPTRRSLLDELFRADGQPLNSLEARFPMTRFGVMKHLRVLEDAGMIVTRRAGREKLHFLNAVPVQLIADRWVGKYTRERAAALADLKAALEGGDHMPATGTKPRQLYEVYIKASPEKVWQAITSPEFTSRYFYGSYVESTFEPKAKLTHYSGEDRTQVAVEGEVIEADPPRRLVHTWQIRYDPKFAGDAPSQVTWEIASDDGQVSKLTVIHEFDTEDASFHEVASGWSWVVSNLKTLLETGEALPHHD